MRASILIAVILFIVDISYASAALDHAFLQRFADKYNNNIDGAPDMLKELFGNERGELNVVMNNGSILQIGFEMKNARIVKTHRGGISNPTIDIGITEGSVNIITRSNDKAAALQREIAAGRLTFNSKNQFTRAKLGLILSNASVLKFLGGIL